MRVIKVTEDNLVVLRRFIDEREPAFCLEAAEGPALAVWALLQAAISELERAGYRHVPDTLGMRLIYER